MFMEGLITLLWSRKWRCSIYKAKIWFTK